MKGVYDTLLSSDLRAECITSKNMWPARTFSSIALIVAFTVQSSEGSHGFIVEKGWGQVSTQTGCPTRNYSILTSVFKMSAQTSSTYRIGKYLLIIFLMESNSVLYGVVIVHVLSHVAFLREI